MPDINILDAPGSPDFVRFGEGFGQRFILTVDAEEEFDWGKPLVREGHSLVTVPYLSTAHVWPLPMETEIAVLIPVTETGVALSVVVPLPSWPLKLRPQHCTPPPLRTAQLWLLPAATATAEVTPTAVTGRALFTVEPLPSWP